jgi:hypothetical protein
MCSERFSEGRYRECAEISQALRTSRLIKSWVPSYREYRVIGTRQPLGSITLETIIQIVARCKHHMSKKKQGWFD